MSVVLEVRDFAKTFLLHEQDKLIPSSSGVALQAESGQLTALIGPTGAGKSSVLKGIYRTYLPTAGEINYCTAGGQWLDLARLDEQQILELRRTEIGFVTQFLHALPRQSALDVVAQPLYQRGVERNHARQQAAELLQAMNLPERLWSLSPGTFSGGEKQRVNLARGLIARPRLLLLDEPTASLDPNTTDRVVALIDEIKQQGSAVLAIFHDPALVERLADQVVSLRPPQLPMNPAAFTTATQN